MSLTERALQVRRQTLPEGHWRNLLAEENLACLLREQGQAELADTIVQRWAAALVLEEFARRLSLQACLRVLCL